MKRLFDLISSSKDLEVTFVLPKRLSKVSLRSFLTIPSMIDMSDKLMHQVRLRLLRFLLRSHISTNDASVRNLQPHRSRSSRLSTKNKKKNCIKGS